MSHAAPPALLDDAISEILRATGQLLRRLRAESNPSELTWSQLAVLGRLADLQWATTAALARAESVKPQSMGPALATLESEGLVQRRPDPADSRQVLFGLTKLGVTTRARNTHLKREWLASAMSDLTAAEQKTLVAASGLIKQLANS